MKPLLTVFALAILLSTQVSNGNMAINSASADTLQTRNLDIKADTTKPGYVIVNIDIKNTSNPPKIISILSIEFRSPGLFLDSNTSSFTRIFSPVSNLPPNEELSSNQSVNLSPATNLDYIKCGPVSVTPYITYVDVAQGTSNTFKGLSKNMVIRNCPANTTPPGNGGNTNPGTGIGGNVNPVTGNGGNTDPVDGNGGNAQTTKLINPLTIKDIQGLIAVLLGALVQIAIPFLVLAFMYVGFLFVAARGSGEKIAAARQAFFWTVVGTLMVLGAQLLSTILAGTIKQLTEIQ